MHDRNGAPLRPGELVHYRFDTIDVVTAEVVRAGPGSTVVVAVPDPFPSSSEMAPMTISAYDQLMATARDAGAPPGCLPVRASPDTIEKV